MITVVSCEQTTSACPTQWEGKTADGQYVYARYRGGRVAVYVGVDYPSHAHRVFELSFGHPLAGCLNGATLAALTKDTLTWPAEVVNDGQVITEDET